MYRKTFLEIDSDSVINNVAKIEKISGKKVIAVLKANAYGVGGEEAINILKRAGIDFFAVATLEEAIALRKLGADGEILILGSAPLEALPIIRASGFTIITVNKDYFSSIADLSGVKIHIKVDTGMHRNGIRPQEVNEVLQSLLIRRADVNGIMTHYAYSDELKEEYTAKQYQLFKNCLLKANYPFHYIHTGNTDAAINFKDELSNYVRVGLGLWGYSTFEKALTPSLALYSEISNVKKVAAGEAISYGCHYISDGSGYIFTIPIGYADGLRRSYTGNKVMVNNQDMATIVGSICMDQTMLHCPNYYPIGTKVEIFGPHIPLNTIAEAYNTIDYEVLTSLSDRLTRVYLKDKKIYREVHSRYDFL